MSAADQAKQINAFINKLPKGDTTPPPEDRTPIEELVYAFLLWESTQSRADNAMKRINATFVDLNDLRVSRDREVAAALGKTYPLLEERVMRLQASLEEVYIREYEVNLDAAAKLSKRDARKYIETLEGMVPFVAARLMLFKFEAHAIPVEQRLIDKLITAGVLDEGTDIAKAQGLLERHIKSEDALDAAIKFQEFSENGDPEATKASTTKRKTKPKRDSTASTTKRTTKKTASRKASSKKTSSKKSTSKRSSKAKSKS